MVEETSEGANFVVIGGGTGSFTLLTGLKRYVNNITALVNMADDGGSTGQLRDELGVLPPGDIRQCLVALSDSPKARELFNYRFNDGALKGHAFGNLFLAALEDMTGSFPDAVELASEVLKITGRVEPVTLTNSVLCSEGKDGHTIRGQFVAAHEELAARPKIWLEPEAEANPDAIRAIENADIVVIAPGNLYGSLAPALIVPGVGEALVRTAAKCVYVANLVTKPGPTHGYGVHDFADELERLAGYEFLDYVLYNTEIPSQELMEKYAHSGEFAVAVDKETLYKKHYIAKGADLLSRKVWAGALASDPIASARSFIRHNPDAVARELMRMYFA